MSAEGCIDVRGRLDVVVVMAGSCAAGMALHLLHLV